MGPIEIVVTASRRLCEGASVKPPLRLSGVPLALNAARADLVLSGGDPLFPTQVAEADETEGNVGRCFGVTVNLVVGTVARRFAGARVLPQAADHVLTLCAHFGAAR